jgi:hypothetical protein
MYISLETELCMLTVPVPLLEVPPEAEIIEWKLDEPPVPPTVTVYCVPGVIFKTA